MASKDLAKNTKVLRGTDADTDYTDPNDKGISDPTGIGKMEGAP